MRRANYGFGLRGHGFAGAVAVPHLGKFFLGEFGCFSWVSLWMVLEPFRRSRYIIFLGPNVMV